MLGFSACLMQYAEVIYELSHSVKYVVGSEEVIKGTPEQGQATDYSEFLKKLSEKAAAPTQDAAMALGETYINGLGLGLGDPDMALGGTISVVRPDKLLTLSELLKSWVELALSSNDDSPIRKARDNVVRFNYNGTPAEKRDVLMYADLFQFMELYRQGIDFSKPYAAERTGKTREIMDFITSEAVIYNAWSGRVSFAQSYDFSHGIGIHVPFVKRGIASAVIDEKLETKFSQIKFNVDSGWLEFLERVYSME